MINLKVSLKDPNISKAVNVAKKSKVVIVMTRGNVIFKAEEKEQKKGVLKIMEMVEGYQLY